MNYCFPIYFLMNVYILISLLICSLIQIFNCLKVSSYSIIFLQNSRWKRRIVFGQTCLHWQFCHVDQIPTLFKNVISLYMRLLRLDGLWLVLAPVPAMEFLTVKFCQEIMPCYGMSQKRLVLKKCLVNF